VLFARSGLTSYNTKNIGELMKKYKVLITSTLGKYGDLVMLPDNSQTVERLKKGIVCEVKIVEPNEVKAVKPNRKGRAKK
jgi:hypothetical protein